MTDPAPSLLQRLEDRDANGNDVRQLAGGDRVSLLLTAQWLTWELGAGASISTFGVGPGLYSITAWVSVGPWTLTLDVHIADLLADWRAR